MRLSSSLPILVHLSFSSLASHICFSQDIEKVTLQALARIEKAEPAIAYLSPLQL